MAPKFSVVIPVYNRRDFLLKAVESSLRQTATSHEVVVSDDCSSEDLRAAVTSFQEPRIRYYRNETRLGASRNHQQAVSRATGSYVLALNSDDLLLPECLEVAGRALDERDTAAAVYFSPTYLSGSKVEGFHPMPKIPFADASVLLENPWLESYHGTSPTCCLFRKAAFDRIGGYRPALRLAYDYDLYMRFMRIGGGVVFLPEVLSVYRKHPEQMCGNQTFDGLRDMLDLWHLPEYSHWPSSTVASLVLLHCLDARRRGGDLVQVVAEIRRQKLWIRLLAGVPTALFRKAFPNRTEEATIGANYRMPNGVDQAIESAGNILKAMTLA
jgi:GT2 family glycosyltransferase